VDPTQTIELANRTPDPFDIGIEPIGEYHPLGSGSVLTIRTTFVVVLDELKIGFYRGGVTLFILGPLEVHQPDGATDGMPSIASDSTPAPPRTLLLSADADRSTRLRLADGTVADIDPEDPRWYTVTGADQPLRLAVDGTDVRVTGWGLRPV
jgi:hypothetical protein